MSHNHLLYTVMMEKNADGGYTVTSAISAGMYQ